MKSNVSNRRAPLRFPFLLPGCCGVWLSAFALMLFQPGSKKGKRKGALLLLTLLFIIIAVAYGIYWFLVLRHYEETDDAYVAGNQVQIMAQVAGSVTKVWADNTRAPLRFPFLLPGCCGVWLSAFALMLFSTILLFHIG